MKRSLFFERRGRSISRVVVFVPRLASRPTYGQGSEREETEREGNRKLTVIAFNVTRARTDQSQLLEVTESRGRRRNQLLSAFWWNYSRKPMVECFVRIGDSRRFHDDWKIIIIKGGSDFERCIL